jgi:methionyl-tRNA formyltransferase
VRLAGAGADLLVETLRRLTEIAPQPQEESQATWAPVLKREDGKINFTLPAPEIVNRVRGFQPWPGAFAFLRGQRLQIWSARADDKKLAHGTLVVHGRGLFAGCAGGAIELLEVQMEGKKRMPAAAFLNGFPLRGDEVLE